MAGPEVERNVETTRPAESKTFVRWWRKSQPHPNQRDQNEICELACDGTVPTALLVSAAATCPFRGAAAGEEKVQEGTTGYSCLLACPGLDSGDQGSQRGVVRMTLLCHLPDTFLSKATLPALLGSISADRDSLTLYACQRAASNLSCLFPEGKNQGTWHPAQSCSFSPGREDKGSRVFLNTSSDDGQADKRRSGKREL